MKEHKNIILGAGISGLMLDKVLNHNCIILEKENKVGGLCNSIKIDDFIFDITGHYLHIPDNMKSILNTINCKMERIEKQCGIGIKEKFIDYPFQSNFHSINDEIKEKCIKGYFNRDSKKEINNLEDWVLKYFGKGIAEYFLFPYNEKLWQHKLSDMTVDWIKFIPRIDDNDILYGNNSLKSYNSYFYYPEQGGFYHILPNTDKQNIIFNEHIIKIDIKRKIIYTKNNTYRYDNLISTIPLKILMELINEGENDLSYISVYNINLGIRGKIDNAFHWIYFPEKEIPFYRVGIPSNVNKNMAPENHYSLSIEFSYNKTNNFDFNNIIYYLEKYHLIKNENDIIIRYDNNIKYAYVIYDKKYKYTVNNYTEFLKENSIFITGRFGKWHYSFVAQDIMDAITLGEQLNE